MDRLGAMQKNGGLNEENLEKMMNANPNMQQMMNDPRFQAIAKRNKMKF